MRKLILIALMGILSLGLGSTVFAATDDLTELADYYGEDTLVFASIRTDDALLTDLDTLVSQMSLFLPPDLLPEIKPSTLLAEQVTDAGFDLEEDILSWLGDAAAIGIPTGISLLDADIPPLLISIEVDGAAALAFFEPLLAAEIEAQRYTVGEQAGFTVYESVSPDSPTIAFGEDVLFLGTGDMVKLTMPDAPLSAAANFTAAIDNLPADDYAAVIYVDYGAFQSTLLEASSMAFGQGTDDDAAALDILQDAAEYLVAGISALDERTLIVDSVAQSNLDILSELDYELFIPRPIDPAFAARVPADAIAVIHTSEFGPAIQNSLDSIRATGTYFQENGGYLSLIDPSGFLLGDLPPEAVNLAEGIDLGAITGVLNMGFAGFTGISLERDFLPVLDGDMAFYLRAQLDEQFFLSPVLPDFGMIVSTSDGAAAQDLITDFKAASDAYESGYELEAFGAGQALNIDTVERLLGFGTPNLDLLVGADDDVFVFGTRNAATRALDTTDGLAADPTFSDASAHFVDDAQLVLYLSMEPVTDLLIALIESGDLPADPEAGEVLRALSLLESASVSIRTNAEGLGVQRFAITLGAEPLDLEFSDDVAMAN